MRKIIRKAAFFDRDGVLNLDTGYPHRAQELCMVEGADQALKLVNACGFLAFIVTNQGGIGLGLYSSDDVENFNKILLKKISAQGGEITDIAFCPHHPKSPHSEMRECSCRKPKPGMITMLAERHHIDLTQSILVGDRDTDIEAARRAGCKGLLFAGGNLHQFIKPVMASLS